MLEKITDALKEFNFLTPKDLFQLVSIAKLKQVASGELIVKEGDYNYNVIKVIKGLLSHYVVDKNGYERALLFVPEKMNSGSLQTTINRKPSDENIIALENSLLLLIDIRELEKLAAKNNNILKLINQSYKKIIAEAALRIKFLLVNSPEERYLHFREIYPHLLQRVKQKDLASYLGITVTSLSRIRARISKQ
jgi:CRP-like cAMP-binding protein